MRPIDADALMEIYMDRLSLVADRYSPDSSECGILAGAMKLLDEQPTIEPERKTGKWIKKSKPLDFCTEWWYECSECGSKPPRHPSDLTDFCPNCGSYNGGLS